MSRQRSLPESRKLGPTCGDWVRSLVAGFYRPLTRGFSLEWILSGKETEQWEELKCQSCCFWLCSC